MPARRNAAATARIIAAVISAVAVIIVGYWQYGRKPAAPAETELTYAGRVVDANSETPIRKAKVTLEIHGAPPVVYADSEGVYSFKLALKSGETVEGRIRIVAEGYENFDRNISISAITRLEDVRLRPALGGGALVKNAHRPSSKNRRLFVRRCFAGGFAGALCSAASD